MNKILVTGCNGYIGQHLTKRLMENGHYVVGLDRVDEGMDLCDEFIHQDILDTNPIRGEFDTVIHLAALIQVGGGQQAMMDYYRNNVVGTMNMLERVDFKNFIFASTCQSESDHVYGTTKWIGEKLVRQYSELNNKSYSAFRFGNVVGTDGFYPNNPDGLLHNLMVAEEQGTFYVYGNDYDTPDGSAMRDYIHVNEICYALNLAVDKPTNSTKYLGHGKLYSVFECIEAFKKSNNCNFDVVTVPRRAGDPPLTQHFDVATEYLPPNISTLERMMKV